MMRFLARTVSAVIAAVFVAIVAMWPLRADMMDGAAQVTRTLLPPVVYTSGAPVTSNLDCFRDIRLGGNTQFTLTIGNPVVPWCKLRITNIDVYSGVGTGRGKLMSGAAGVTAFWLYPGQAWEINWEPTVGSWRSVQPLNGQFGFVWFVPSNNLTLFMDTGASSDTANDGLASGANGALKTIQGCVNTAYQQIYMRNQQSTITCSNTASQTQTPGSIVTAFYQLPNASLSINSATPGTKWTWNCPAAVACFQFGDNFLGGMTDITMVGGASAQNIITGHQFSILDLTNMGFTSGNSGTNILGCDFDTHYNINATVTSGTINTFIFGCQGSSWQVAGAQTSSASSNFTRLYVATAGSKITIQGGASWSGWGTGSPSIATGNSVINNLSGATPPGGAVLSGSNGGQACTSPC